MMVTKKQFAANRRAILDAAVRSFKQHGVEASGVGEIMTSAGLTPGGFYNHFESKEMLFAAAVSAAFTPMLAYLDEASRDEDEFDDAVRSYLSREHRDNPADGCPLSTLLSEVAFQGPPARGAFTEGVAGYVRIFEQRMASKKYPRSAAIAALSTMVGAMVLARATRDTDEELSRAFLVTSKTKLARERATRKAPKRTAVARTARKRPAR